MNGVGPLRSPLPKQAYRRMLQIAKGAELLCMEFGGLKSVEENYRKLEPVLFRKAEKSPTGKVKLAGHSQTGPLFVKFASLHPELVEVVIDVAGPNWGADLAGMPILNLVPCSRGMSHSSEFLAQMRQDYALMMTDRRLGKSRPRVACFAVVECPPRVLPVTIVKPWHSSLLHGAENFCFFHRGQKPKDMHGAKPVSLEARPNHFNVILLRECLDRMAEVMGSSPVKPVGPPLAKAA
jgi:hypothetical protein